MENSNLFSNILGDNLPYGEKNPFVVSVDMPTVYRLAFLLVAVVLLSSLANAYARKVIG